MNKIEPPQGYRWKIAADEDDDFTLADPHVLWVFLQKPLLWGFLWVTEDMARVHWVEERDVAEKVEDAKFEILEKRQESRRLEELVKRLNS